VLDAGTSCPVLELLGFLFDFFMLHSAVYGFAAMAYMPSPDLKGTGCRDIPPPLLLRLESTQAKQKTKRKTPSLSHPAISLAASASSSSSPFLRAFVNDSHDSIRDKSFAMSSCQVLSKM
jgi:hypothetical protein